MIYDNMFNRLNALNLLLKAINIDVDYRWRFKDRSSLEDIECYDSLTAQLKELSVVHESMRQWLEQVPATGIRDE